MATEADLIQKFKDLNIPVGADFEELIHEAFIGANLVDQVNSKADDSKVVHTADMRKPANQVASIDEVNTKQDKIGYTPADDSKVVHTTDTSSWQKQKITNDDGSIIKRLTVSNGDDLNNYLGNLVGGYTTFYVQGGVTNNPSNQSARGFILKESAVNGGANFGMGYLVDNNGNVWSIAVSASTTPTYTLLSNDSKVAHLSGANNFDTVPTVNNNPLLLASSLPSDLARTSQQTNFTNGLQSGGVDVATAADLKSLEDASWHEVDLPDTSVLKQAHFMYRSEPIDTHYNTSFTLTGTVYVPAVNSSTGVILLDLSSYLPIPKDDYKNYTVNSAILGPSDNSFIESDNAGFSPNYYLGENYLGIKLVNSDLVLYSTSGYAYFGTALSTGATIALVMNSGSNSLPTIDFVSSTKS